MGGDNLSLSFPHFTVRLCVFGSTHAIHGSWTVPMSPYEYNEWCQRVQIGIHCLQWSPQSDV
eukprot:scaffold232494_cov46-Cyclotella_meneghiniana.AAC.1